MNHPTPRPSCSGQAHAVQSLCASPSLTTHYPKLGMVGIRPLKVVWLSHIATPPHVQKPTPGDDQQFVEIELHDGGNT